MTLVVADFETYYSKDYQLRKMSTEEYVQDPQFQTIGLALWHAGVSKWVVGAEAAAAALAGIDWSKATLVAHNARFDAMILERRYGIVPKQVVCTMSMARAAGLANVGAVSLAKLSERMQKAGLPVPLKGTEVSLAMGKRLEDFDPTELAAYGEYAVKDAELCLALFSELVKHVPKDELRWQSSILKSASGRHIRINKEVVEEELKRLEKLREDILIKAANLLRVNNPETVAKMLRSKEKFRLVLEAFGGAIAPEVIETGCFGVYPTYHQYLITRPGDNGSKIEFVIPTKLSVKKTATVGKEVYDIACAKADPEFVELTECDNEEVAFLCQARLSTASTISESRAKAFARLSKLGDVAVPLLISGAHTHRMSGADKLNMQNLPSGRAKGQSKALRISIEAPSGHSMVVADASQIEARVLAFTAGQTDLLDIFAADGDPYSVMGAAVAGVDAAWVIANKDTDPLAKRIRQLGKALVLGCGYGMGWAKFEVTAQAPPYSLELAEGEAQQAVKIYRDRNWKIVELWRRLEEVGRHLAAGGEGVFGGPTGDLFFYSANHYVLGEHLPGIRLPDGLWVVYPNLRLEMREKFGKIQEGLVYERAEGNRMKELHLYGGKMAENITQALAFSLGKWQSSKVAEQYPIILNEHDAWAHLARDGYADHAEATLRYWMTQGPTWAQGLPLGCEAGQGVSLGAIAKRK